ncbi:MAG: ORF6N domain protein [Bacteroidetes bacterium ADurb.Bin217]|nr:MAG: ORF6N domain protein [Bacteroidetes bacterium ADurb.Bin217]
MTDNVSIIPLKEIENRIYTIRGVQVMLDNHLAEMYGVETKVLNQAVKRNLDRFPDSFRFKLTEFEANNYSRSQFVTLNSKTIKQGQNIKYLPYVFTEQGVAMLSAVLRSETAVQVSIQIIDAFVQMRKLLLENAGIFQRLDKIEIKQKETDQKFEQIFRALEAKDTLPIQGVFFDGQVFDAYELVSKIIRSAKHNIVLIDNYIDESILTHLTKKQRGVQVHLLTKQWNKALELDVQKANEQYPTFTLHSFSKSHDRFLIIDNVEVYHIGASLKDLGKKWFAFSRMEKHSVQSVLQEIREVIKM